MLVLGFDNTLLIPVTTKEPWKFQFKFEDGTVNPVCFIQFIDRVTGVALTKSIQNASGGDPNIIQWSVSGPNNNILNAEMPFSFTSNLGPGEWAADLVMGTPGSPQGRKIPIIVRQINPGEIR